jgi:preprotein translocase subunit SecF
MFIVRYRKIFFAISLALMVFAVGSMVFRGFNLGIDFTGGSIVEVSYENGRPDSALIHEKLAPLSLGSYSLRPTGEKSFVLRTKELDQQAKENVFSALSLDGQVSASEDRSNTIGPVVGQELRTKALVAIAVTILGIVLFVTFAFRKVSQPVSSWKYGITTIIALVFDVAVPAGIFIALTPYTGAEIDLLFVTALLAILGYSVHDTIVVFDRVRENLRLNMEAHKKEDFESVIGRSLTQTMARSINTSLTLIFVLLALYFLGGESTRHFALLLTIGAISGTYSSVFLASPILIDFEKLTKRNRDS